MIITPTKEASKTRTANRIGKPHTQLRRDEYSAVTEPQEESAFPKRDHQPPRNDKCHGQAHFFVPGAKGARRLLATGTYSGAPRRNQPEFHLPFHLPRPSDSTPQPSDCNQRDAENIPKRVKMEYLGKTSIAWPKNGKSACKFSLNVEKLEVPATVEVPYQMQDRSHVAST